jgi:hypothetical protein
MIHGNETGVAFVQRVTLLTRTNYDGRISNPVVMVKALFEMGRGGGLWYIRYLLGPIAL